MTDVLRIAHPQNRPPYGNSRVGICEKFLRVDLPMKQTGEEVGWQGLIPSLTTLI